MGLKDAVRHARGQETGAKTYTVQVPDVRANPQAPALRPLLHRLEQLANEKFAGMMGGTGMTARQYDMLAAMRSFGQPVTQTDLVTMTGIDRSTAANILARLQRKGWIKRPRSRADARARMCQLTAEGCKMVEGADGIAARTETSLQYALSTGERRQLISLLTRILERHP